MFHGYDVDDDKNNRNNNDKISFVSSTETL